MNINDISEKNIPIMDNFWNDVFKIQHNLIIKYNEIELKVMGIELLYGPINYFHIDNQVVQLKIKEYLWRISEELGESYECIQNAEDENSIDIKHQLEELSDGLHFFVELLIKLNYNPKEIYPLEFIKKTYDRLYKNWNQEEFYLNAFTSLAKIGNCLKNKPWKQSQMQTDRQYMYSKIKEFSEWFMFIFFHNNFSINNIFNIYSRKSQVNQFRQNTNY